MERISVILGRQPEEQAADELLTLALFRLCSEGNPGDRLTSTKLIFLPTLEHYREQAKGFNFNFFRYKWGPFTPELYETWGHLVDGGFLRMYDERDASLTLTKRGHELAQRFIEEVLTENHPFFADSLRRVAEEYGRLTTAAILQRVYALEVTPVGWNHSVTIGSCPEGTDLTRRLPASEAVLRLEIPDHWLDQYEAEKSSPLARSAGKPASTPEDYRILREAMEAESRGEGEWLSGREFERRYPKSTSG